jgi:hypothetical protein
MATNPMAKTVDPSEARIWAALESETTIQQVTYDEANASAHGRQPGLVSGRESGAYRQNLWEKYEVVKRKYKWLTFFVVILVAISVALGSILGLNAKDSPSSAPTSQPTFLSMDDFKRGLPAYSLKMAQINASSPQAKALAWLQSDNDYELYRLNQRYALGVLFYSTNIGKWSSSRSWMSKASECAWYTDSDGPICDELSRLTALVLLNSDEGFEGSIPRELGLLTDLKKLQFPRTRLSAPIYSDLYVSWQPRVWLCYRLSLLILSFLNWLMMQHEAFQVGIPPHCVNRRRHPKRNVRMVIHSYSVAARSRTMRICTLVFFLRIPFVPILLFLRDPTCWIGVAEVPFAGCNTLSSVGT